MTLQEQIDDMSKVITTDSYPMSIGELANIYKDGDLDLHPEFQRFFRWDIKQKSNLIESILLGIPIPPIFVYQNEQGVWDVIDGLQRLSTIFEFMGILRKPGEAEGELVKADPSKLVKTKFLPALLDKVWECPEEEKCLTDAQRRYIKRSKLDIKIIEKSSDANAKYELFQRLNTGGAHLSPQEIRNCLLVMINNNFYQMLKGMNDYGTYKTCLPLTENSLEQQNDMEMVVRFVVARHSDLDKINRDENMHDYLTERVTEIAKDSTFDLEQEQTVFKETFDYLNELLGADVFRKYSTSKGRFEGSVLISSFESIVLGVSKNLEKLKQEDDDKVIQIIKGIYVHQDYNENTRRGIRALTRFRGLSKLSLELFSDEN